MTEKLPCPLRALLAIELDLLDKYREYHANYDQIRSWIEIWQEVAERVHADLPCEPRIADDGQLVCSIHWIASRTVDLLRVRFDFGDLDLRALSGNQVKDGVFL